MIKGTYKRAELVIPRISKEKFLSLSAEEQKEYLRLYREQVAPKFEEWRKPHSVKIAYGGRGAGAKSESTASLLIQFAEHPDYFGKNVKVICLRSVQKSIKDSSYSLLCRKIEQLGYTDFEITQNYIRNTTNGSYFTFNGLNDLSLFNPNQKATSKEVVTTKQLAEILGVDIRTVQRAAERVLDPSTVLTRVINGGKSLIFDEEQATTIKREIQKHHNLANRQVDKATTELVTVKELANILHVSDQTVRNIVKELFDPSKLLWRVVNGGNTLYLTTEQATAVKLKLRDRNNLKDNSIVSQIGNDLEFFALLKKREEEQKILDAYRDRRIAELQAENERQKAQLTEQAPKVEMYNKLVDRSFCKCLRDTAQFIGEHEKHFLQVLQDKKIIYKHAGHYRAYADYADCFELKVYTYGENKTGQQLLVNIKGLELVKKIFKGV